MNPPIGSPRHRSLTVKQAGLALLIAGLLSLIVGGLQLAREALTLRDAVHDQTLQRLTLVEGAAAEAAFQLSPALADRVTAGLAATSLVAQVTLRDDFGRTMSQRGQPASATHGGPLRHLFGDILHYRRPLLRTADPGEAATPVGELELVLDLDRIAQTFLQRGREILLFTLLEALAIAALLVAAFHRFITRPLLRIHAALVVTNPRRPGQWPRPRLTHHQDDELGHLVESLDHLLTAFQHGLDQRDRLHQISTLDGLTGIANRRRFDEYLPDAWQRVKRGSQPLAVIFIDIDNFKDFNDRYGHALGDETLRAVAQALNAALCRATDLVARYGGEEFVCVLSDTDLAGARAVAHRLREAIHALAIPHAGTAPGHVTASFGIAAMYPTEDDEYGYQTLLEQADSQLYRAKHRGRDQIVWTP